MILLLAKQRIHLLSDNFLKAVWRPDGEIGGWRPMEDEEAKDGEATEEEEFVTV